MKIYKLKLTSIPDRFYFNSTLSIGYSLILCFTLLLGSIAPLYAQPSEQKIDQLIKNLEEAFIKDVVILSSTLVESNQDIPKHIFVRGYTMPSNYFQMRIPVDIWNEKNFIAGCGAGCGTLPTSISGKLKKALERGYATTTMNTGHWSPSIFDFSWAYNNPQAEKDYAYRAVHEAQRATLEIIKVLFKQEPKHSYFWGCSGGGRQAVMAAAKYPEDFDGIISEGPALSYTNSLMLLVWLRQTNTGPDGKDILVKEDIPLIRNAVYGACDSLDGDVDGLISNPTECYFDPETLLCQDNTKCLDQEKVEVLKKWYQGPLNSKGEKILTSGVALGSEPFWGLWLLGESNEPFNELLNSENMLQYTAFKEDPGDSYSVFDFNFDSDPDRMEYMGNLLNVTQLSLEPFKDRGGKLLMFHGSADPAIPYQYSVDYFDKYYKDFGEETIDFFRLFLVPGMDHCTVLTDMGITEDSVDPLSAIENWVEKGLAPKDLPATRFKKDGSVDTRLSIPLHLVNEE